MNLENRYNELVQLLRSERNEAGFWCGKLSSSALATAVSIVALKINDENNDKTLIVSGLEWIISHQNEDGGFGDTPTGRSNVSTTLLSYAALSYCGLENRNAKKALEEIKKYLSQQNIILGSEDITSSILSFYGNDFTFSVPILSMLVICGLLDNNVSKKIPQLPFELTLFPARWYSFFNLRVVSYAIPALIGVGIFIFRKRKKHNPLMYLIRNRSIKPALQKLEKIVPESGGFLEAVPLTAFVAMCLIESGAGDNLVITKGLTFLRNQQRPDGSWPIDTDLSTWVTTLSIKALGGKIFQNFNPDERDLLVNHLNSIQYKDIHPFNLAKPGGWGWTNFPGSVPDVDDTCGAILALLELYQENRGEAAPIIHGCEWLTTLQNKDGGFPTFCKGWGRLPFDSSCADLTGHALLALVKTLEVLGDEIHSDRQNLYKLCISRSFGFLWKAQHESGCWVPLWFGNQYTGDQKNRVYGTARVAIYLKDSLLCNIFDARMNENIVRMLSDAQKYLKTQQNGDGSWGGELGAPGTIEESALALSALADKDYDVCLNGFKWIDNEYTRNGLKSNPIGLYFAMLWYDEKLFPLIFYIEALRRFL